MATMAEEEKDEKIMDGDKQQLETKPASEAIKEIAKKIVSHFQLIIVIIYVYSLFE